MGLVLALAVFLGFASHLSTPYEVTLLDTTRKDELGWQTYREGHGLEWREITWFTGSRETRRGYATCSIAVKNVKNWLRMPYLSRGEANRLYIEINFTSQDCNQYTEREKHVYISNCEEHFELLYHEAASDLANTTMPIWNKSTYTSLGKVAADNTFTDLADSVGKSTRREIPITQNGVYFAFFDPGACTTLLSVRVYYIVCLSITANFAVFPNTTTGPESSSFEQQEGTCVPHAAIEEKPTYICSAKGKWRYPQGGCKCMPGYAPDTTATHCSPCKEGTYKWQTGNVKCSMCPTHSEAPVPGAVECHCKTGYYRSSTDQKSMPCTQPPSPVRNLSVIFHDQSMVNLSWQHPANLGGRSDFHYSVECANCGSHVSFHPQQHGFNTTKVSVLGLNPDQQYKLMVEAENGVSEQSGMRSSASVTVTTHPAIPAKVVNLQISSVGLEYISVAWQAPAQPNSHIEQYEVCYFVKGHETNSSSVYTRVPNATFRQLQQHIHYCFKVRGKARKGWGQFSHDACARTGSTAPGSTKVDTKMNNPVGIIAGSAVAVVVCMIIVIIMVIIFLRRNHHACREKNVRTVIHCSTAML